MPYRYRIDFVLYFDGKVWAVVEYKNRSKISVHTYKSIILSCDKVFAGLEWVRARGCKFKFVVEFSDGFYATDIDHEDARDFLIVQGGRTDRNDEQDIEPVYHIPIHRFKRLIQWQKS